MQSYIEKMKQKENHSIHREEDFSVLSLTSAPNESLEHHDQEQHSGPIQGHCLIIWFVILGFYFLVFGILELSTNSSQMSYRIELIRNGNQYLSRNTFLSFKDQTELFLYLQIQNLTQFDTPDQQTSCRGYTTNQQMQKNISIIDTPLDPNAVAIPCGKYVSYYPEGNLEMIHSETRDSVLIETKGISHTDNSFPSENSRPSQQWADLQNERLKNWMTLDANQQVKKLWGRIKQIVSGTYQFKLIVRNEMPQVDKIILFLNNNSALSGYNNELCYVNFFYALLVFIGALSSFFIKKKWGKPKVLKKKPEDSLKSNEIKIFLNSAASTPAVKFD